MVLDCHALDAISNIDPVAVQSPALKDSNRTKLIIDTDPGIDDAMAIFMAFQSPELEVIGLTTIFGNGPISLVTKNALHLCEVAGLSSMPVAEGCPEPLKGGAPRVAYFAHGIDGLGNTFPPEPKLRKIEQSAVDFLVEKTKEFPHEVTILALGPLTNIAEAMRKDPSFATNVNKIFVLGGSFFASGNVNPAAEANIYGDPDAADIVFTSGAEIVVIGINLTTQLMLTESDLLEIRDSKGKFGKYVYDMCLFYKNWHFESDGLNGIFLHDPGCIAALLDPTLFTYRKGVLRVETQGICIGHTLLDLGLKKWNGSNAWTGQPLVTVGWTVDTQGVVELVKEWLKRP
ncbi:hypothetical protein L7F22_012429 [Adiantum nelumboides]|nr:hypothetical protein [Adiantum nelumboides]